MDRRRFISVAMGAGVGALVLYYLYRQVMGDLRRGHVRVKDYLEGGERAALLAITPNEDFYITSKGSAPSVNVEAWRLKIDGLVEKSQEFTLRQILELPAIERYLTLECISNPVGGKYIGNAVWRGIELKPLLEQAKIKPEAHYAVLYAADGYSTGIPVERMLNPANFLAYEMKGEPLPREHGFPLRIFIPGKYGMKQPKWLTRIEFVNQAYLGYWEEQGWSDKAERRIQSVIDDPADGGKIRGANFVLTGYAITDLAGIKAVELSFDDGRSWQPASIFSNPSPQVWTFWKYVWVNPANGKYTLRVRALDGRGQLQTAQNADPFPEGASGYHRVKIQVL